MNSLVVPGSPNWYSVQILACAPDNTLIYGSKNDVIVIYPTPNEKPLDVKFFYKAHSQKVVSIDVNIQWGSPNKWAVSAGEDNHVKLWDLDKFSKISSHEAHKDHRDKVVGARFLTEDRILSVSESGVMYIWHPSTKEYTKLSNFFLSKVTISCFSPCPHATFITAFGMKDGLIVVANLKKKGTIIHKLRGHINEVVSLSWCPAPINVFPSKPENYLKGTRALEKVDKKLPASDGGDCIENGCTEAPVVHNTDVETHTEDFQLLEDDCQEKKSTELSIASTSGIVTNNENLVKAEKDNQERNSVESPLTSDIVTNNEDLEKVEDCQENNSGVETSKVISDVVTNIEDSEIVGEDSEEKNSDETSIVSTLDKVTNNENSGQVVEDCEEKKSDESGEKKTKKENPWINLKFVDDDEIQNTEESAREIKVYDFLEECDILRKQIQELSFPCEIGGEGDHSMLINLDEKKTEQDSTKNGAECNINKVPPSITGISEVTTVTDELERSDGLIIHEKSEIVENKLDNQNSTAEIKSVASPPSIASFEEDPRHEFLLASSGKDSTVYIWRAGTDGRMQCFFRLPEKKIYSNRGKKQRDLSWTVVKWVTPFTLLTATKKGDLLKYTVPKPLGSQKQYTILHNEHSTLIFSIAAYVPTLTAENWLSKLETNFWTFGHDMYLLNTVLDSKITHLATLQTFCALIQCIGQSPLDPSRICIGLSNGAIKIWNTNDPHVRNFCTSNYSLKIFSKITYLAWHPANELLLAFCTDEGTVGILNTNNSYKATWFKQSFSNTVHKIQWGPSCQKADKFLLYAAGEGNVLCFDLEEPKIEPVKIKFPPDTVVYTFAWKMDYSLMLVVDNTGKIFFLAPDFSTKATYYSRKKIAFVAWHPDSACNLEESTNRSYLVAAALGNAVHIFDFAEVSQKDGILDIQSATKAVLEGHQGNVKSLAWNSFNGDLLVTAGDDGIANVWNVETRQVISSYYTHNFEPVRSIIWSPIHEDILICSSANASLVLWKMSDYPAPLDEEILEKCKLHMKNESKNHSIKEDDSIAQAAKKAKKSAKNTILPVLNSASNDNTQEKVKFLQELLDWKEKKDIKTNGLPNITQLFGTKEDVVKLLSSNEISHKEKGKCEAASMVSFWKGDLRSNIKDAIDNNRVTPLLIALAPTISMNLWQEACQTYAVQLEEKTDSDPLDIATYYLACQNIEKAISSLCEREMFKEALTLAKCRLPEDSVFVEDILQKWATFSSCCGSLETAAQCYIVLGKFEDAVKVLFRRTELDILNFALELAKKTDNSELIKAVEFRCKAFTLNGNQDSSFSSPDKKDFTLENEENSESLADKQDISLENNENGESLQDTKDLLLENSDNGQTSPDKNLLLENNENGESSNDKKDLLLENNENGESSLDEEDLLLENNENGQSSSDKKDLLVKNKNVDGNMEENSQELKIGENNEQTNGTSEENNSTIPTITLSEH